MAAPIPQKIGKYEIRKILGRGTTGVVYLGIDPFVQRRVAIKVARTDHQNATMDTQPQLRSFFNEARTAGMLLHPHIVSIYDAGIDHELRYIVMEYVPGQTLKHHCDPARLLPVTAVVDVVFKCCKALEFAHGKGIVHRDIKPTNIMLGDNGVIKLMDFSIAQLTTLDETQPTGLVGSPTYMSPEQVREEPINAQTDLWSLGAVMYELLTGVPPFFSPHIHALVYKILNDSPVPVRKLRSEVPEVLTAIIDRALAKKLEDRYQSAQELGVDLTRAFESLCGEEQEIALAEKFNALKALAFFKDFTNTEIQEIIDASVWHEYPSDTAVITEGDIDDSFYIMTSGEAEVRKGATVIGQLMKGDCFGEIGFVTKAQRTATIVSTSPVRLIKVNSTRIEQASVQCQLRFHKVFLVALIERLSQTPRTAHRGEAEAVV